MSSSGGRDMTRSPNIDSPPTARTSPDNSIRNDKKKRSIIPKIFGSKRGGKSIGDGESYRIDTEHEDDEVDLGRSPIRNEAGSVRIDASRGKAFTEASPLVPKSLSERHSNPRTEEGLDFSCSDLSMSRGTDIREFRIFVGTWNVGGRTPTSSLNLEDFLQVEGSTDVYVLGFQEIVPLSAGNVLVAEDNEPASKWLLLINQALNRPNYDSDSSGRGSTSTDSVAPATDDKHYFQKPTLKHIIKNLRADSIFLKSCNCHLLNPTPNPKSPNREGSRNRKKHGDDGDNYGMEYTRHSGPIDSIHAQELFHPRYLDNTEIHCEGDPGREEHKLGSTFSPYPCSYCRYRLVASKQMVGLFLTVWARKELVQHIGHLRMTSIGRGIMGYLGNKGCITVSMSLHNTSFCFVCSHLASGEKEGDELRRNADVSEIIKNTQFPRICRSSDRRDPEKILHHDRVIWMGDLNYRVSLSYEETRSLLEDNDWDSLLQRDQLNMERKAGRVFSGFKEGRIFFAPTYKYTLNSDCYAGETGKPKKRRTPAWCDRILWIGNGIEQLSYIRGESRFSDHRPVCSVFSVEVELKSERRPGRLRKGYTRAATRADYDERMRPPHQQYYEL